MRFRAMGLALILLNTPTATLAAETVEVHYEVFWGGFRAAEARLVSTGGEAELAVRATGMAESLAAFALDAESQRDIFHTTSRSQTMDSTLAVDFHGTPHTTIDTIRHRDPDDQPEPRAAVPEAMKIGTLDPLTAMVAASRHILAGHAGEHFTVPVYDGRNRYDALVTIIGPGSTTIGEHRIAGTRATIQFKPLAGFREESHALWDGARFNLLLDPATQLPARIVSESFTVGTVISAVPVALKTGG